MYDTYCSECNKEEDRGNPRRTHTEFSNIEHSSQLPPEVVSGIVECVGSAFGSAPGDTAEHIKGDRIFLSQQEGKVVGFVSLGFASPSELFVLPASAENPQPESFSEQKGVYLAAATVSKEHQDTNIFRRLLEQSIDTALREERMMFSTRTQNPIVENAIHKVLQRYQRDKAISGYSLRRVLMKGCYGQMLTTEKPQLKNKKDDIQRAYDAIDQEAGDAYVLEFTLLPRKKGNR